MTKNQVIMSLTISKYAIHKVTTRSAYRRQQQREAALNQQHDKDSQQNNMKEGEIQQDTSKNINQSTSHPSILNGNEDNSLSTRSTSDNNNDINTNDFPLTKQSSTTTKVKTEPPTKIKTNQQLKLWHQ